MLELDACGYVEPANPRWNLTYAQKLEIVRKHRSRWDHPEKVIPTVVGPLPNEHDATNKFVGGVYVQSMRNPFSLIRQLHFYQLPSPNKGTEYKYWTITDVGLDARDFGIDPEQDLLVLLEGEPGYQHGGTYMVHLRTMSTNEAHPKISDGYSTIVHQHPMELPRAANVYFEMSGQLLAILFRSGRRHVQSYVVIWDWTTGTELSVSRRICARMNDCV